MTKAVGSLGGRDDVTLARDLAELERWQPTDTAYLEADELGGPGDFPTRGYFLAVQLLDSEEERYVQVTEGLDGMLAEALGNGEYDGPLTGLTVDVDTAEKAGGEETSPWRYSASIVPLDELGPPDDD